MDSKIGGTSLTKVWPGTERRRDAQHGSDQRQSQPWVNRTIELAETIARQLLDVVHTTFPRLH
jgi:hypothetical protein